MKRGVSTSRRLTKFAQCLQASGVEFVIRYLSTTTKLPEKRLTADEALVLSAAGLQLGVVYEDNPVSPKYFSGSRGHLDGVNAYHASLDLHQTPGSAIYFAVDYDASSSEIAGPILDYFKGVEQGMRDGGGGVSRFAIGIYGSGAACDFIKGHCPFVKYAWLAESTGWLGSKTFSGWDVKQSVPVKDLCGLGVKGYEDNVGKDDFGLFSLSFAPGPLPVLMTAAAGSSTRRRAKGRRGRGAQPPQVTGRARGIATRAAGRPVMTLGQKIPNKAERDVVGLATSKIVRGTPAFAALVSNTNSSIAFKDEEGTGADRMMTSRLAGKLDALATLVATEFPGSKLRVTEAWDENNEHSANSVHYEARGIDLTTLPLDQAKLGRLGRLAVDAGFDWVFFEDTHHIHASVAK